MTIALQTTTLNRLNRRFSRLMIDLSVPRDPMTFCILCGETVRPGDLAAHKIHVHGEQPPPSRTAKCARKADLSAGGLDVMSGLPKPEPVLQKLVPLPLPALSTGSKSKPKVNHRHRLIGAAGRCTNSELRCVICDLQGPPLMGLLAAGWLPLCTDCLPHARTRQIDHLAAMAKGKKRANAAKRAAFLMKQITVSGGGANGTGKRR